MGKPVKLIRPVSQVLFLAFWKGVFMKKLLDNIEEYLCSIGLVLMTIFTFLGVISRKLPQVNLSWTMELVTTIFVWVCSLAAAAVFKHNAHMGFSYLTDKLKGIPKNVHRVIRVCILVINFLIWIIYGFRMVAGQLKSGLVTPVMSTPGWLIGIAIPVAGLLTCIRLVQYELGYKFTKI